jgi:hypothetical protein
MQKFCQVLMVVSFALLSIVMFAWLMMCLTEVPH